MTEDFRKEAEEHWKFVQTIITPPITINDVKHFTEDLLHYLYVEAMIHGYKHAKQAEKK